MEISSRHIESIRQYLKTYGVSCKGDKNVLLFLHENKSVTLKISQEETSPENRLLDDNAPKGKKIAGMILSRLGLNRRVFARDCDYISVDKVTAGAFLDKFHLLNSTGAAYNRGLTYKNELIAVASFSKGRKMRRLSDSERSFELIRFCCSHGISVSGGLSKLAKNFCREKKAGDIMSYVDTRLSDGRSFANAGFEKAVINKKEGVEKNLPINSLKMIYTCRKSG